MKVKCCLIVEDHVQAQTWLSEAVQAACPNSTCDVADSIDAARTLLSTNSFDLVLLDINLPDGNGLDLIGELVQAGMLVVISSVYEDDEHLFTALQRGATGYVLKDLAQEDLVRLLQQVISDGSPPLSPKIAQRVLSYFRSTTTDTTTAPEQPPKLTPREEDVLTLLAKGYTIANAASLLGISPNTVDGYAKAIYRKLNISSRAEAALEAARFGLVGAEASGANELPPAKK